MRKPKDYFCHALDNFNDFSQLQERIKILSPYVGCFKVGLEAHAMFGAKIIEEIQKNDSKVFLDLKFHDIPRTVFNAVKVSSKLGVDYMNVHTLGGKDMLEAAKDALVLHRTNPHSKIIGVTVLTSHDESFLKKDLNINKSLKVQTTELAQLAYEASLDGIVCSALDIPNFKEKMPSGFFYITPGIRMNKQFHDQRRVATPSQAIKNGSSLIVVGRSLSEVSNNESEELASSILEEITNNV